VTAPQFFVDAVNEGSVLLSPEDSRHALRSLRLRPGEGVTLSDGRGCVGRGRLAGDRGGVAVIDVESVDRVVRGAPVVSVALAPPKGDRLSWAVQKLAELGVDELLLLRTERSVRTWDGGRIERAVDRQLAVGREAAMQSKRPFVMEVAVAGSLDEVLASARAQRLVLHGPSDPRLSEVIDPDAPAIRLVVGPEGGLSEYEIARAETAGACPVTLGPNVLRTETAAVAGATLVLARVGRLG
jgi:16S rRNA (uracil1498-N3)-methyltransferase